MGLKSFFNLPSATLNGDGEKLLLKTSQAHALGSTWKTFKEQEMNKQSLLDIFSGTVPVIRQKEFLTQAECEKMIEVLKSHKIVRSSYQKKARKFVKVRSRVLITLTTYGHAWDASV